MSSCFRAGRIALLAPGLDSASGTERERASAAFGRSVWGNLSRQRRKRTHSPRPGLYARPRIVRRTRDMSVRTFFYSSNYTRRKETVDSLHPKSFLSTKCIEKKKNLLRSAPRPDLRQAVCMDAQVRGRLLCKELWSLRGHASPPLPLTSCETPSTLFCFHLCGHSFLPPDCQLLEDGSPSGCQLYLQGIWHQALL